MKLKQKIVLFIEPNDEDQESPTSIGNLYMNRFAIDEDAADEILNIYHLKQCKRHLSEDEKNAKGIDPNVLFINKCLFRTLYWIEKSYD